MPERRTGVEAHHRLGLLAGLEERVPVGGVDRGQIEGGRVLREAQRLEASLGVATHLARRDLGVLEPGDLEGDDPLGIAARPHLVVPVVPRPHAREAELGVSGCGRRRPRRSRR